MKEKSDVFHLYAARAARGFGDGFAAIILPAYLIELGFDPFQIGLVATAALLGSAVDDACDRLPGPTLRLAHAPSGLRVPDGRDRDRDSKLSASRLHRRHRLHRHDEPRRPATSACMSRSSTRRSRSVASDRGSHARVRALQPDRRAVDRGRRARRRRRRTCSSRFGIGKIGALQAMFYVYAGLGTRSAPHLLFLLAACTRR